METTPKMTEFAPETSAQFDIMPGMTVEQMKAMFFDRNALIEPQFPVYQLNTKGYRYYYKYDEKGEPQFFPSVTTILSQTMPESPFLKQWRDKLGAEAADRYRDERAAYGTFMHGLFGELLINRTIDLDDIQDKLKVYIEQKQLPVDFIFYADDLKKDVLAFAQWVADYDVRPLAIEIALVSELKHYAGMIDLVCTLQTKEGRKTAIVDFKSGRNGFTEEHELQLHLYRDMWQENFPEHPIDRVFNFSPKDWRKDKPTYNFKDQTESEMAAVRDEILAIAAVKDNQRAKTFTATYGTINLDALDLTKNITSLTLAEIIKTKKK
jgi:hypothetical protein